MGSSREWWKQRRSDNKLQIQALKLFLLTIYNEGNSEFLSMNSFKNLKLEFPRFRGEDPTCWVYKANQFFSYHNTP